MSATFPVHPLAHMQGPFEESMLDATGGTGYVPFEAPSYSVKQRQQMLCRDGEASEQSWNFTYSSHWRHHPSGEYHPVLKTIAQIVFGVHLLHQHLEKSVADVADILLKHVNELDGFLQRANDDIESCLKDMLFRHKCLKVPMEHVREFDRLLEDRNYRAQLLDGNVTIERTIGRMKQVLNDYLVDINTFREANRGLDTYLGEIGHHWTDHNEDVGRIYAAMCGNTGGWAQFLQSLGFKAERLVVVLEQVRSYCNEIEKRCGAASRRSLVATRSSSRNSSSSRDNGHGFRNFANNKPLPSAPGDRPSQLSSPISGTATPAETDLPLRQRRSRSKLHDYSNSDSQDTLVRRPGTASSRTSNTDKDERHLKNKEQPEYYHEAWHNEDTRGRTTSQPSSARSSKLFGSRRLSSMKHPEQMASLNRLSTKFEADENSPPLTGKDSAYSSVSGASKSPIGASSRIDSNAGPRFQLGLSPNSSRGTLKGSFSGRLGSMTPTFGSSLRSVRSIESSDRPSTATSSLSDTPSRRLAKRTSLTSLKRLFTRKRSDDIQSIPE